MPFESGRNKERHVVTEEVRDLIESVQDIELRKRIVHEVRQVLDEIVEVANQQIVQNDPFYRKPTE